MIETFHILQFITARKRSLGQGNIFRSMCQEFCPRGGGVCLSACWDTTPPPGPGRHPPGPGRHPPGPGRHPPRPGKHPQTRHPLGTRQAPPGLGRHPPGPAPPPGPASPRSRAYWEIRSTSGRYASYWNAILFTHLFGQYLCLFQRSVSERGGSRRSSWRNVPPSPGESR